MKHESLKKVDPKFLRNTRSAQEYSREGLETTRAVSVPAEAHQEPTESEHQVPKGGSARSGDSPTPLT